MTQDNPRQKWLEEQIADVMVDDLEKGLLKEDQAEKIAEFILSRIDNLKSEAETVRFLSELTTMYNGFKDLKVIVEGFAERRQEQQTALNVIQLIKQGAAAQAVQVARKQMQ